MKRNLVGTTALATSLVAAMLVSLPAFSISALAADDDIKLKLGGFYTGAISIGNMESVPGDLRLEAFGVPGGADWLFVEAPALDQSLAGSVLGKLSFDVGAQTTFPGTIKGSLFDESYNWLDDGLSQSYFGQEDRVGALFTVASEDAISRLNAGQAAIGFDAGLLTTDGNYGLQDNLKLTFSTPSLAGLSLGLSYASEISPLPTGLNTLFDNHFEDAVEIGLTYDRFLKNVRVQALASYVTAQEGSDNVMVGPDPEEWNFGVSLTLSGFTFGGNYRDSENFLFPTYEAYDVGVGYEFGSWAISAQYATHEAQDAVGTDILNRDSYQVGTSYKFAKGFRLGAGYQYQEDEVFDLETSTFVIESALKF